MNKIRRIEQETKADKRTALLALASHSKDIIQLSACLTPGNMASLVDGQCSPEEQKILFAHLGGCETCYQQWVEVAAVAAAEQDRQPGNKIIRLFRSVTPARAGYMLAAAASVVLYLNIQQDALPPLPESNIAETMQLSKASRKQDVTMKEQAPAVADQASGYEEGPAKPERVTRVEIMPSSSSRSLEKHPITKAIPPPANIPESVSMQTTLRTRGPEFAGEVTNNVVIGSKKKSDHSQIKAGEWLSGIKQACVAGKDDTVFWQQQFEDGRELTGYNGLALLEAFDSSKQKRMTGDILPFVELLQTSMNRRSLCDHVLDRMEKEPGGTNRVR